MSTTAADMPNGPAYQPSNSGEGSVGPLEERHRRFANFRAVADGSKVTGTHWHIATANSLGWGFDGMDGVIFALVAPLIIKDFGLTVPEYRSGLQISLFIGIAGLYVWPWLSDRYGRRTLLAINIALFSLLMPAVAASPTFAVFVIARSVVGFALNGEWSLGSMLVAETWPPHLRGRVISINRAAWCFGASLAGAITGIAAATWGWRVAVMVPGTIALLAIYVRATCPESPYWVRTQDRKSRVRAAMESGRPVSADDRDWFLKADRVGIRQVFLPDILPSTLTALFVACCSTCIFGTVGAWMPLYLATEKHWSTAEYSAFYVCWGIVGFFGLWLAGWLADRFGRRIGFGCSGWAGASASSASGGRAPCSRRRSSRPASAASPTAWSGRSPTSSASCCGRSRRSRCSSRPARSNWPSSASRSSCSPWRRASGCACPNMPARS
jgi:MFS family permease